MSDTFTLPATYGDVTREYQAARSESGRIDGLYELVWFGGRDAVSFLESLISQNVADQEVGTVRRSLLLGPRGKLTAVMWVLRDAERVGLLADAGYGDVVAETLSRYRIRVDVSVERDNRRLTTVVGPEAPQPDGWSESDGILSAGLPLAGNRRSVTTTQPDLPRVGRQAWTAVRVESGEPLMGVDIDESTIPQESGLVPDTVDFAKGCFLGQELVARIDSRGHVNRRLMGILLTTNVLPPSGARVLAGESEVGTITSPAESLALRAPVALSLIRREVEAGEAVVLSWDGGEAAAAVADLPLVG